MSDTAPSTTPADLKAWLSHVFIPQWIARSCRPELPGYVEEVRSSDGAPVATPTRSTMVTGRLIYSFSRAHLFDGAPASLDAARRGLAFLLDACRLSPGYFAHELMVDGRVSDPDADLYDLAFVLLGLAGYAQASGDRDVLRIANEIAERLDGELEDSLGGYREPAGDRDRRRQFPQMHLFEAFQLLARLDPRGGWNRRANRIVDLAARLIGADGGIDEWYALDWSPLPPMEREREIGHQLEWAWLLYQHAALTGSAKARELGNRLFAFSNQVAGIPSSGPVDLVPNQIDAAGHPSLRARPLWPTTEWLRTIIAAAVLENAPHRTAAGEACLKLLFSRSIDTQTAFWINDTGTEAAAQTSVPTRVLYHILPCLIDYASDRPLGT